MEEGMDKGKVVTDKGEVVADKQPKDREEAVTDKEKVVMDKEVVVTDKEEETSDLEAPPSPGPGLGRGRKSRKSRKGGKGSGRGRGQPTPELDESPPRPGGGGDAQPGPSSALITIEEAEEEPPPPGVSLSPPSTPPRSRRGSYNVTKVRIAPPLSPKASPSRAKTPSTPKYDFTKRNNVDTKKTGKKSPSPGPSQPNYVVDRPSFGSMNFYCDTGLQEDPNNRLFISGILLSTPLASVNNFRHARLLKDGLANCHIQEFNALQRAVVPHLYRGDDLFIIGGKLNGKTLSYLVPILGKLLTEDDDKVRSQDSANPTVLILCNDLVSATRIHGHVFALLQPINQHRVSFCVLANFKDMSKMRYGLSIAIIPIKFFCEMMEKYPNFVEFQDLQYLIFENMHMTLTMYPEDFDFIRKVLLGIAATSRVDYQRIFVGQTWCDDIEKIYKGINPLRYGNELPKRDDKTPCAAPTLFLYSLNQVIRYSKLEVHFHHAKNDNEKITQLTELLCSVQLYYHKSIFVLCSTPKMAIGVYNCLKDTPAPFTLSLADTTARPNNFKQLKSEWSTFPSDKQQVMVLNDEAVMHLGIRNVTCLIHYDLPLPTSSSSETTNRGAQRFMCLWENIRSIAEQKSIPTNTYKKPVLDAHFLLTGKEPMLPKLRAFAEGLMSSPIPDELNAMTDILQAELWKRQTFCRNMKLFGRCLESNCPDRHGILFSEMSAQPVLPRSGWIDIAIETCLNPSHFAGRVTRIYGLDEDGKTRVLTMAWESSFHAMQKKLKTMFKSSNPKDKNFRRHPPASYENGTLCIVKMGSDIFVRARIIGVLTRNEQRFPKSLRVFCIDTGIFPFPHVEDVFALPDEVNLKEIPQMGVQLVLVNLQSTESGLSYSATMTSRASDLTVGKELHAEIQISIGETVWVKPLFDQKEELKIRRSKKANKSESVGLHTSVRLDFICRGIAMDNSDHLPEMKKIVRASGFRCPELEENNPINDPVYMSQFYRVGETTLSWSYVDLRGPLHNEIWTTFTMTPYAIFGALQKFNEILDDINEELDAEVQAHIKHRCPVYATEFAGYYTLGLVVAVKDRLTEKWARGLITAAKPGKSEWFDDSVYDVFLVDVGYTQTNSRTSELFPMPRRLVLKLPFQVMAFRLKHIVPILEEGENEESSGWGQAAVDKLIELTLESESCMGKQLDVLKPEKLGFNYDPTIPCRYYSAILLTPEGNDLGECLVEEGVATFVENGQEVVKQARISILGAAALEDNADDDYDDGVVSRENFISMLDDSDDDDATNEDDEEEGTFDVVGFNSLYATFAGLGLELPEALAIQPLALPTVQEVTGAVAAIPDPVLAIAPASEEVPTSSKQAAAAAAAASAVSGFDTMRHPKVTWTQSKEALLLHVELTDVKSYTCKITKDATDTDVLSFRCIKPHPNYGFDIPCPGGIVDFPKAPEVTLFGQYLKIWVLKRSPFFWMRLGYKKIQPWLKPGFGEGREISDSGTDTDEEVVEDWMDRVEGATNKKPFSGKPPFKKNNRQIVSDSESEDEENVQDKLVD